MSRFEYLNGYEFSGCAVRRKSNISFFGHKWVQDDALEIRPTGVFFFYAEKPTERQWAYSEIGLTTGVHGCATFVPNERWVFVTDDGKVYVVGGGDDDYENPVTSLNNFFVSAVRSIRGGRAVCVGPLRSCYIRESANTWNPINRGLSLRNARSIGANIGFSDIAGFSDLDMYACGGEGDLWVFNGTLWSQIDLPTNAVLEHIICANDGFAYITTNRREVIKGRGDKWEVLSQDLTDQVFESIVEFNDRVLISTVGEIYEVVGNTFRKANLGAVPLEHSKAHMASGDGILVVAGRDEAALFDGRTWSVIVASR